MTVGSWPKSNQLPTHAADFPFWSAKVEQNFILAKQFVNQAFSSFDFLILSKLQFIFALLHARHLPPYPFLQASLPLLQFPFLHLAEVQGRNGGRHAP
jgi:hypothetical protein